MGWLERSRSSLVPPVKRLLIAAVLFENVIVLRETALHLQLLLSFGILQVQLYHFLHRVASLSAYSRHLVRNELRSQLPCHGWLLDFVDFSLLRFFTLLALLFFLLRQLASFLSGEDVAGCASVDLLVLNCQLLETQEAVTLALAQAVHAQRVLYQARLEAVVFLPSHLEQACALVV